MSFRKVWRRKPLIPHMTGGNRSLFARYTSVLTYQVFHMLADGFEPAQHKSVLNSALLEAVPNKDLSITQLLLQAGADINFRYDNGDTPLVSAAAVPGEIGDSVLQLVEMIFAVSSDAEEEQAADLPSPEQQAGYFDLGWRRYVDGSKSIVTYPICRNIFSLRNVYNWLVRSACVCSSKLLYSTRQVNKQIELKDRWR